MVKNINRFIWASMALLFLVASCTTMLPADTLNKKLLVAKEQYAGVLTSAIELRKAGVITDEQKPKVTAFLDNLQDAFDAADTALSLGDIEAAEINLKTVNTLLLKLTVLLKEQEAQNGR